MCCEMPADTDELLASPIEVRRGRRRTIELSLEFGRLVGRVPKRMARSDFEPVLEDMRQELCDRVRSHRVFDDDALQRRADIVARQFLSDQPLGHFEVSFSRRQKKRWGSCTRTEDGGRVRISSRLLGHPNWIFDHLLLHELSHIVHANHGPEFQALLLRSPDHERGQGYLEALESLDLLGTD
jgi:YgjP-like, metallopeptidase domain